MGLERVAAVLQNKISNFETDLFTPLIDRAAELTNFIYIDVGSPSAGVPHLPSGEILESLHREQRIANASLRIISDHARAATFLINDGVLPSNEGRSYVLRKILRRGIRHGRLLGQEQPFLNQMVYAVRDEMKCAYPDLIDSADRVARVIEAEEKQFDRVLNLGMTKLDELFKEFQPAKMANREVLLKAGLGLDAYRAQIVIPGDRIFHLYETYGLPMDFMADAARDAGFALDEAGFEACSRRRTGACPCLLERRRAKDC
jgi:alanyl-tRNA synthetase